MAEFWRQRNVFVTGATGLLGPWLTQRLVVAGANVVCLIRDGIPRSNFYRFGLDRSTVMVRGSVEDYLLLERVMNEYEINTVFHLAAQAIVGVANRSPLASFETNIRGTWNTLEAARVSELVQAVIVASSDKAYGEQTDLPYTEQTPVAGTHPYDVSKSCADLLAHSYFQTYGLPVAVTRCGNLFGGGDLNFSRLIPGTIRSVLQGQRPVIRSDGEYVRDYFYVEDAANAYLRLAEQLSTRAELHGQAFNFSNDQPATVLAMTRRILEQMGSNLEPDLRNEASNEILKQYLSSTKARERLGWQPLFSMNDSLARTIRWYEAHLSDQPAA